MPAIVGVFNIAVVPIRGIFTAIAGHPEFPAVDSVPQKRIVERHDVNFSSLCCCLMEHPIIFSVNCQSVGPGRQVDARCITNSIGWIVDIAEKDVAATWEAVHDQVQYLLQAFLIGGNPWLGLLPRGTIHGAFARWLGPVPMDQVIATGRQNDDPQGFDREFPQVFLQRGEVIE